jgi:hypothetical protein
MNWRAQEMKEMCSSLQTIGTEKSIDEEIERRYI